MTLDMFLSGLTTGLALGCITGIAYLFYELIRLYLRK